MEEKVYSAKTLSDAITDACAELGLTSDKLDYKIVQEGKNGFFGIGAKPYIISVRIKSQKQDSVKPDKKPAREQKNPRPEGKEPRENRENKDNGGRKDQKGKGDRNQQKNREDQKDPKEVKEPGRDGKQPGGKNGKKKPEREQNGQANQNSQNPAAAKERGDKPGKKERGDRNNRGERNNERAAAMNQAAPQENASSQERAFRNENNRSERRQERGGVVTGDPVKAAEEFLTGLFSSMEMNISYQGQFKPENNELVVNLSGEDMGVLIGKRGQTLDALQYLTSQVVNKHQTAYIRVKLDTENYRERRKETMEALAQSIAQKVRKTKRPVALEPMNPYERRIIHSVLQADKEVITRSEGVEPYRHVVVCPVRKKKGFYGKSEPAEVQETTAVTEETVSAVETAAETIAETMAEKAAENITETVVETVEETASVTVSEITAEAESTVTETIEKTAEVIADAAEEAAGQAETAAE